MEIREQRPTTSTPSVGPGGGLPPAGRPADELPMEAPLVDELRADPDAWIPELSLVAVPRWASSATSSARGGGWATSAPGTRPRAHRGAARASRVTASDRPSCTRRSRWRTRHEPLIGLLGNPAYYGRFGFVRSTDHGIEPPDPAWGEFFQVLPLDTTTPPAGRFAYAAAFG